MFCSSLSRDVVDVGAELDQPAADQLGALLVVGPGRIDRGNANQLSGKLDQLVTGYIDLSEDAVGCGHAANDYRPPKKNLAPTWISRPGKKLLATPKSGPWTALTLETLSSLVTLKASTNRLTS